MAAEQHSIFEIRKKGQGVKSRLVALTTSVAFVAFGCYALWGALSGYMVASLSIGTVSIPASALIPSVLFVALTSAILYIMNLPKMVDFLINTEAELRKVAWPGKDELIRQTIVVIATAIIFTVMIAVFDLVFSKLMTTVILPG